MVQYHLNKVLSSIIILLISSSRSVGNCMKLPSIAFSLSSATNHRQLVVLSSCCKSLSRLACLSAQSRGDNLFRFSPNQREWRLGASKDDSGGDRQLRTGWLHRTVPRSDEQKSSSSNKESTVVYQLKRNMIREQRNHRIVSPPTFYPSGEEQRSIVITEHLISVPLQTTSINKNNTTDDIFTTNQQMIDVFFTVTETLDNEAEEAFFHSLMGKSPTTRAEDYVRHANLKDMQKAILYLQGGPGFAAPSPISGISFASKSSWAGAAFSNGFKRIVLMDQRGTGRSSPITKQTLQYRFPGLFALDLNTDLNVVHRCAGSELMNTLQTIHSKDAMDGVSIDLSDAVNYLTNFRADSIVHDAEAVKDALLIPAANAEEEARRPWGAVLGQSFGGFCIMTYLSKIENPPKLCLLTGGIAPMLTPTVEVYMSLWERVKQRNFQYYERYPGDIGTVKRIVCALLDRPVQLPSGGNLTARRFLQLGLQFLGSSPSSFASLHNLIAVAFVGEDQDIFSKHFLKHIDSLQPFDNNPIYFLLHESIYANSKACSPTNWAAHSVYENLTKTPSEYRYDLTARLNSNDRPTLFFGEMVFPWMADGDYAELSGVGMKLLAHALAQKDDWTSLYNSDQMKKAFLEQKTKAAAAVYYDDLYVDFDASIKVTRRGAPLEKCKVFVTNEYQHSGLRDNGAEIFHKLFHMCKGSVHVPS